MSCHVAGRRRQAAGIDARLDLRGRGALLCQLDDICGIGIKRAIGKLDAPEGLGRIIVGEGFLPLPINFAHAEAAGRLPLVRRDPFDRMLIAQPLMKSLVIATVGTVFDGFDVGIPAKQ
jgi:hypothetical protein